MMKGTSIRRMLLQMEDRLLDWMIRRDGQYANAVSLSNEISSKIEEENEKGDNKKLIITGHSLGGGLATIEVR